jgi:hypothetical protein
VVYAGATITPTKGQAGVQVDIAVNGLNPARTYSIYFGFIKADDPGTVVGSIVADMYGKATGFFAVPALANGDYKIQFYDTQAAVYTVLNILPVFTIGAAAPPPIGTGTFTPSAPALLDASGKTATSVAKNLPFYAQVSLRSNVGVDLSVSVIAQITDSPGKIVTSPGITMADVKAAVSKNVPVAFLGISAAGTYTVTIYVWDNISTPTALAPMTTLAITVT